MKKRSCFLVFFSVLVLIASILSCSNDDLLKNAGLSQGDDTISPAPSNSITGNVQIIGMENAEGCVVIAEKRVGGSVASVFEKTNRSLLTRSVVVNSRFSVVTDSSGRFSIVGLPDGIYTVTVKRESTLGAVVRDVVVGKVQQTRAVVDLDIVLTATGRMSGKVTLEGQSTDLYGSFVYAEGTSYIAATDGEGNFELKDIPVGTYNIVFYHEGYLSYLKTAVVINAAVDNPVGTVSLTKKSSNTYLSAITFSDGTLSPAFNKFITLYDLNLLSGVNNITLTPTVEDSNSTVKVNGVTVEPGVASEAFSVNPGKNVLTIDVISQTGIFRSYNIVYGKNGVSIVWKGTHTTAPASPELNWAYYNSADGISYIYDGTTWQILAKDGTAGADGTDGQNGTDGQDGVSGVDGISVIWKGTHTTAPASPELNWAYYNSADGVSYIYDGTAWQILAKDGTAGADGTDGQDNTAYMYVVLFNSYGATTPASYSMKVLRSPENTVGTLPSPPVKTHYTFDGWFTEINGAGEEFTGDTVVSGDIEVYAKWIAEYSITYTLNGGSATNPGKYTVETNTFTLTNPTRTLYTFVGWSGTDLTGTANTTVTITKGSTGNKSYTANWIINQYTVTYSSTGHTAGTVPSDQIQNYNTTITVQNGNLRGSVIVTSKVWQRFTGWNTATNGSGTMYQPGATFTLTGSVTLYAQYTTGTSVLRKQGAAGGWVWQSGVVGKIS